jgi:hypothetical protein
VGLTRSSLRSPLDRREKPRFIPSMPPAEQGGLCP